MKTRNTISILTVLIAVSLLAAAAFAGSPGRWAVGIRSHQDHTIAEEIPFGDGDMSYQAAYEIYDAGGVWQFALGLANDLTPRELDDTNAVPHEIDQVLTPEVNLLMQDNMWVMGVGGLASYVEQEDEEGNDETEWTDIYWQIIMGVNLPIAQGMSLKVLGYYPYEDWGDLAEIDFDDMDFGAWLTLRF